VGPALSELRTESVSGGLLPQPDGTQRARDWEGDGEGVLTGGGLRWQRSVTAAEGVLLGRPGPAVGRGSVRVAGNARRSGSSASSGELDGEG
jgi:hypothetical protein